MQVGIGGIGPVREGTGKQVVGVEAAVGIEGIRFGLRAWSSGHIKVHRQAEHNQQVNFGAHNSA